ncbi:MAG: hypothetical protein M5U34_29590 [Chloroflexi bacterium]|nr:hypothetical protein [Chloroflexota bacterium]
MNSLKRQAIRAQNYEQVAQDLRHLLRIWYGFKWEQAKDNIRLARERATITEKAWQETRQEYLVQQRQNRRHPPPHPRATRENGGYPPTT